jgi:hypothetical protein
MTQLDSGTTDEVERIAAEIFNELVGSGSGVSVNEEYVEDITANALLGGTDIGVSYDDGAGEITIDFTGSSYTAEKAREDIAAALTGGTDISVTHDDGANTITMDYTGTAGNGTGVDVENVDGSTLLAVANPIHAGANLAWSKDGDGSATLDAQTGGSSDVPAAVVETASGLQSAIDTHHTGETQFWKQPTPVIEVKSGSTLNPSNTIRLKEGIQVNWNGALIQPDADIDVVQQDSLTFSHGPVFVDTSFLGFDWNSSAWTFDAGEAGESYENRQNTVCESVHLRGDDNTQTGTGTGFYLTDSASDFVAYVKVRNFVVRGFDYGVLLEATDGGKWVNDNHFTDGHFAGPSNVITIRAKGTSTDEALSGNQFHGISCQPFDTPDRQTQWLWDLDDGAAWNILGGWFVDTQAYANDTVWRIGSNCGQKNVIMDYGSVIQQGEVDLQLGSDNQNSLFHPHEAMSGTDHTL